MNKLVKGSLAGAAGIALLLGGAGTFALWNDSQAVNGGTVETGTLDLSIPGAGQAGWFDLSSDAVDNSWDPPVNRLVPGDTIAYVQTLTITATGKNLKGELSYAPGSIVIAPALVPYVTVTFTATQLGGDAILTALGGNKYSVVPVSGGATTIDAWITVAVSSTMPNQVAQTLANGVDLTGASVTLTQVRP